jgi:hypothetical protein
MALIIDDARGIMTSDAACVVALRCCGGCERNRPLSAWHVSGHAGRVLTRSEAITAMLLAEREASGDADGVVAAFYRQELGLV